MLHTGAVDFVLKPGNLLKHFRLCNESLSNFDPHINRTHLQECLKRLLCLYDEFDWTCSPENNLQKHRLEFEALYLIVNLGNTTALLRTLGLPKSCRYFYLSR